MKSENPRAMPAHLLRRATLLFCAFALSQFSGLAQILPATTGIAPLAVDASTGGLSGWTTGAGLTLHGGGTITGASGALTLTGATTIAAAATITGTNTLKFGVTSAATLGVSADTTGAVYNSTTASAGSWAWLPSGGSNVMTLSGAGALTTTGQINSGSHFRLDNTSQIFWLNRSAFLSPSDGVITVTNNANTSFTRIDLGGDTSAFPAIKRNSAALNFRLADDSADAAITAGNVTINATSAVIGVRTATATLDFGSILAAASADLTITLTGAAVGDTVAIALPATVLSGAIFNGWVSSANTVTVRCNNAGSIAVDPASATYRATVVQF